MMYKYLLLFLSFSTIALAQRGQRRQQQQRYQAQEQQQQYQPNTTPVPILRQINTHNDDGSYTYGYEGADGSYKVETKTANGDVKGKYGYYDDVGQLREIEYGATRDGFRPSGTGINIPPPNPVSNNNYQQSSFANGGVVDYDDDGQYRPEQHERPYEYTPENTLTPSGGNFAQQQQPAFGRSSGRGPRRQQRPIVQQQNYNDASAYHHEQYLGQQSQIPQQQSAFSRSSFSSNSLPQQHHPNLQNHNLETGSYSISY